MPEHKIIFTGPVGAGKTTAIATLSDIPIVRTDELATDMTTRRKPNTTVAMDYGVMNLDSGGRVHLFGTPGQERFDFMWDILTQGGLGLVLLLDNSRPKPFNDLLFFLNAFRKFVDRTRLVVGVTFMDERPAPGIPDYSDQLRALGYSAPVFEVDARRRQDVATLVEALLYCIDPGIVDHV